MRRVSKLLRKIQGLWPRAAASKPYPSALTRVGTEIRNNSSIEFQHVRFAAIPAGNGDLRAHLHGLEHFAVDRDWAIMSPRSGKLTAEIFHGTIRKGQHVEVAISGRRILHRLREKINP